MFDWTHHQPGPEPVLYDPLLAEWQEATPETLAHHLAALEEAQFQSPLINCSTTELCQKVSMALQQLLEQMSGSILTGLAKEAGLSEAGYLLGMEQTILPWSVGGLLSWIDRDLGNHRVTQGFVQQQPGLFARQQGIRLFHIQSSNVGAPALETLVAALLMRSPILAKVPSGSSGLSVLFLQCLLKVDVALAALIRLAHWPGGSKELEQAPLSWCEALVVHGSDDTVQDLMKRVSAHCRVIQHGHKLSFALVQKGQHYVGLDALALDFVAYDQRGCLSPRLCLFVGSEDEAEQFAALLVEQMSRWSQKLPRGSLDTRVAVEQAQLRGKIAFTGRLWHGDDCMVALDGGPLKWSPTGRFVLIQCVDNLDDVIQQLKPWRNRLQGVSLLCGEGEFEKLAQALSPLQIPLIARAGLIQRPPAGWPADGRLLLSDLAKWSYRFEG